MQKYTRGARENPVGMKRESDKTLSSTDTSGAGSRGAGENWKEKQR